jgi:hypothetical protein
MSRTIDGSGGVEGLHGCEIDDGDGDNDGGADGVCLRKWDRVVSNGSDGILVCEVIVSIRGHVAKCMLI